MMSDLDGTRNQLFRSLGEFAPPGLAPDQLAGLRSLPESNRLKLIYAFKDLRCLHGSPFAGEAEIFLTPEILHLEAAALMPIWRARSAGKSDEIPLSMAARRKRARRAFLPDRAGSSYRRRDLLSGVGPHDRLRPCPVTDPARSPFFPNPRKEIP
ncbi:MAG: hypothetical protein GY856_09685 [bacterium]|nr:hypothetical protein [bacterium]